MENKDLTLLEDCLPWRLTYLAPVEFTFLTIVLKMTELLAIESLHCGTEDT